MTTNARLGDTILAAFIARRSLLLENAAPTIRVVGSRFSPSPLRVREFLSRIRVHTNGSTRIPIPRFRGFSARRASDRANCRW